MLKDFSFYSAQIKIRTALIVPIFVVKKALPVDKQTLNIHADTK